MKAWITKFLIYALIPLLFFIEGYADGPDTDILNRASQDMGASSTVTDVAPVAREVESEEPQVAESARWLIEGRVSYFRPQEKILRKIYGKGWADYQLLVGYYFTSRWSLLALGGYRKRTGYALNFCTRTKVREVPITLEMRFNYLCCPFWKFYLGAGPSVLFFKETIYLPRAKVHNSKGVGGGYVETGTLINIYKGVVLNIFAGYFCYPKESFSSAVTNGSGASLKLGGIQAGLGYQF